MNDMEIQRLLKGMASAKMTESVQRLYKGLRSWYRKTGGLSEKQCKLLCDLYSQAKPDSSGEYAKNIIDNQALKINDQGMLIINEYYRAREFSTATKYALELNKHKKNGNTNN
jgi:hypothetical protein